MLEIKYDDLFTYENIYLGHLKSRCGKRDKGQLVRFEMSMLDSIRKLYEQVRSDNYTPQGYHNFVIYEPKRREIQTLKYPDRLVQFVLCDKALAPYLTKRTIMDNSVCQKGKGMHFGLRRFEKMLRKYAINNGCNGYVLKCDISKYFATIPHEKLIALMKKHIADEKLLSLIIKIITGYSTDIKYLQKYGFQSLGDENYTGRGVPIGNQTSQLFGMFYLDNLDRIVKEKWRVKIYSRYMDDFVIVHRDKEYLIDIFEKIKIVVADMGLKLNAKSEIFPLKNGIKYLGFMYRVNEKGQIVKKVSRKTADRFRKRVKFLKRAYIDGAIDVERIRQTLAAYHGHLKFAHCYKLENKIKSMIDIKKD